MTKRENFIREIMTEASRWLSKGIITDDQFTQIRKYYAETDYTERKTGPHAINLPKVIIALATVCISVGIVIFYAANWKKMPPSLKLIQIFSLIIGINAAAYYLLLVKNRGSLLGRALLFIGMVSFGAGIMLVAQVYHISAHPTNGIFVWAAGVTAIALLMRERFGLYFALLLFCVWHCWEFSVFNNPNYIFAPLLVLFAFIFKVRRDISGIIAAIALGIGFIIQINVNWVDMSTHDVSTAHASLLASIPFGIMLICSGWLMRKYLSMEVPANLLNIAGWVFFLLPFAIISWPYNDISDLPPVFMFDSVTRMQSAEYLVFLVSSCALAYGVYRKIPDLFTILAPLLATAVLSFFLPMGNVTVRMVSTHLIILFFFAALLYIPHRIGEHSLIEFNTGFVFAILILLVKGLGFISWGFMYESYQIAYCVGFIVFATVCFLLNHLVDYLLSRKSIRFNATAVNALCAILLFGVVYILSFKLTEQKSIFDAKPIVITMLVLFVTLSVFLYSLLLRISPNRIILNLSLIVFLTSLAVLLISRPNVSWIFYSLVFNLLLFIFTAVFIYYSTVIQSKILLNIAIIGFVLQITTRYFDLFWDMLSGSALFLATGIAGLAGGWFLDRKRRQLIKKMESAGKGGVK
jgi:uncharacterized membrane protein